MYIATSYQAGRQGEAVISWLVETATAFVDAAGNDKDRAFIPRSSSKAARFLHFALRRLR
jgi:hypothetical protein